MQTMYDLFKSAGYENFKELPINTKIIPKTKIKIKTWDIINKCDTWSEVTGLFYKGESDKDNTYEIITNTSSFLCTGDHLLFDVSRKEYRPVKELPNNFLAKGKDNTEELIYINKCNEIFSILDIEVSNNFSYYSAGVLSHNSIGNESRMFTYGLRKLNPYLSRYGTTLVLLNQVRDKIGGFSPNPMIKPQTTPGGHAIKFYASWRAQVSHTEDIYDGSELMGNNIKIKNIKSKIGIPKRSAELKLYYNTGFNPDSEYLDFIINLGLVKKAGAWLSNEEWEFKGQGTNSLLSFLHEHKDIFEDVKKKVNESFYHHNSLDDLEIPDPVAEENGDNTYDED